MPTVPVTVWEQVPVIIVFALLLAGLGWLLMKVFTHAVADIHLHYSAIITSNNEQWQKYFDARAASDMLISNQVVEQLDGLTNIIKELVDNFKEHDQMERQALDSMAEKRVKLSKKDIGAKKAA